MFNNNYDNSVRGQFKFILNHELSSCDFLRSSPQHIKNWSHPSCQAVIFNMKKVFESQKQKQTISGSHVSVDLLLYKIYFYDSRKYMNFLSQALTSGQRQKLSSKLRQNTDPYIIKTCLCCCVACVLPLQLAFSSENCKMRGCVFCLLQNSDQPKTRNIEPMIQHATEFLHR